MRFLHTSDWHLGRTLYGKKRYEEFQQFLNWTIDTLKQQQIDVLIIAGDIFDTTAPSNRAQQLYYDFLVGVRDTPCRHVIVIGGNHDSASFLNAPKAVLKSLNVHVVGAMGEQLSDELILLKKGDEVEAIVCAVPYLRDRDLRASVLGESDQDKQLKLVEGLKQHYAAVCVLAEQKREQIYQTQPHRYIPIIGTGHLFAAGGETIDGDGVRDLYIGTLGQIGSDAFPACLDYVALGHLHVPQYVNKEERIRYSGSPIAMGYGEANQQKIMIVVDIDEALQSAQRMQTHDIAIPRFQALARVKGTVKEILATLMSLRKRGETVWVEVEYTGEDIVGDLREQIEALVGDSTVEVLRIRNNRIVQQTLAAQHTEESLDDLDLYQVFERRLDAAQVPADQRESLMASYREIVRELDQEDSRAE